MRAVLFVILWFQFTVIGVEVSAQSKLIFSSYKYTMGDNETKVDAKRNCFIEAKRRCLEKAGTFLESVTEVQNFQLKNDEIRAYAAAFLKVEVVSEEIELEGEGLKISMTVKAVVDTTNIRQQIERLRQETKREIKLKAQNSEIDKLGQRVDSINVRLSKIINKKAAIKATERDSTGNKSPPTLAKEVTVYITRTGSKYHRLGCRYLRRSMIPMSLNEVKKRFAPCSVCLPPN